ncbi:Origin recognition complex subunit 2 (Origin recognition complex protein 71 kDa subunit), partial [Scheffersomyces stipitis CBS 6054]
LSPIKTPNGRAGLRSPQKRSAEDIESSARKRAVRSLYFQLMDEGEDSNDDSVLDDQDKRIAESIIRESHGDEFRAYGSDVELEEDLTVRSPSMGRGKRRAATRKKYTEDSEEEDFEISRVEEAFDSSGDEEEENDDDLSEDSDKEFVSLPRKAPSTSDGAFESPANDTQQRKKVGRPRKSDGVVGKVKSIFHQDDELLFNENRSVGNRNVSTKRTSSTSDSSMASDLLNRTTETSTTPVISGIRDVVETEVDNQVIFEPMPLPKVDGDGNIVDTDYLKKYFSKSDISDVLKGRFLDDNSFFLEGSEGYFEQHNGRARIGGSSLASLAPSVDYSEYIRFIKVLDRICGHEKSRLADLHKFLYHQWCFELSEGYNLNFFGVGSKLSILKDFASNYFPSWFEEVYLGKKLPQIMVVNGYNPSLKFKKILQDILSVFIPKTTRENIKFPKHVSETVPFLIQYVENQRKSSSSTSGTPSLLLLINNIDGECFRNEKIQSYLSVIASLPEVWLVASMDNINAPLLWDSFKLKKFNFLWHDLTTYSTYSTELSFKDVLNMGKSKKFVGNVSAKYVLSSLTDNHKNLYKVLLKMQLDAMGKLPQSSINTSKGSLRHGVEFKALYEACVEQFISSNEITFRTMLSEYVEHKMCKLVTDDAGVEVVFIQFTYDEMNKILNEEF